MKHPTRSLCKIAKPYDNPFSNEPEEESEREKKMLFIVATYVYASSQGQRTHSAWTKGLFIKLLKAALFDISLLSLQPWLHE
jgi:hypothetical protein